MKNRKILSSLMIDGYLPLAAASCLILMLMVISGGCDISENATADSPDAAANPGSPAESAQDPPRIDKEVKESTTTKPVVQADVAPPVPKKAIPIPPAPILDLGVPTVVLSEAHAEMCKVKVGDSLPDMTLPDLRGDEHRLADLYGERLTVVLFWHRQNAYAVEQFRRLGRETFDAFSQYGVAVVAVNTGDTADLVKDVAPPEGRFASLLDSDGAALDLIATERLPRTYLLDAEGKILWFDIEYSRASARELKSAVYHFLRKFDGIESGS